MYHYDPAVYIRLALYITTPFLKSEPTGSGHFQPRQGVSTNVNPITAATTVTDRAGIDPGSPIRESNT